LYLRDWKNLRGQKIISTISDALIVVIRKEIKI